MTLLNLTNDPKVVAFRKKLLHAQYCQKHGADAGFNIFYNPPLPLRLPPYPPFRHPLSIPDEDDDDSLSRVHFNVLAEFIRERRKELEESPNYQELLLEQEKRTRELTEKRLRLKHVRRPGHLPQMMMMKKNGDLEKLKTDEVELEKVTKVDGDGTPLKKCKLNDVEDGLADAAADEMMAVDVDLNLMGAGLLKPCAAARNASHSNPQ